MSQHHILTFVSFQNLRFAALATLIFTVAICVATLTPLPKAIDAPGSDKLHHFIAFGALTYPLSAHLGRISWPLFIGASAFGGAIEIIQPFVNRNGEMMDFLADMGGCAIGVAFGILVAVVVKKCGYGATDMNRGNR
jgi:VanZ family protein